MKFQGLCGKSYPPGKELFGGNLTKEAKESEATIKLVKKPKFKTLPYPAARARGYSSSLANAYPQPRNAPRGGYFGGGFFGGGWVNQFQICHLSHPQRFRL